MMLPFYSWNIPPLKLLLVICVLLRLLEKRVVGYLNTSEATLRAMGR